NPRFALATRIHTATEELLAASDFIAQEVIAADAGPPRDVGGDGAIGVVAYVEHAVPLDSHGLDARRGVLELGFSGNRVDYWIDQCADASIRRVGCAPVNRHEYRAARNLAA